MESLGVSLEVMMKELNVSHFSLSTVAMIGIEMVRKS
jgi:hypothetical protein